MKNKEVTRLGIDQDIVDRLDVTRAKIEAASGGPVVVAITSARPDDGGDLLACGLAQSLANVGRSVLFVRMDPTATVSTVGGRRSLVEGLNGGPSFLRVADSYSLDAAQTAFSEFRDRYAFTIVSAGLAAQNGSALSVVGAADFVLVAVEQGRSSHSSDRELAATLRSSQVNTLGVVTISRAAIRSYALAESAPSGRLAAPLHETSRPQFFSRSEIDDARAQSLASRLG